MFDLWSISLFLHIGLTREIKTNKYHLPVYFLQWSNRLLRPSCKSRPSWNDRFVHPCHRCPDHHLRDLGCVWFMRSHALPTFTSHWQAKKLAKDTLTLCWPNIGKNCEVGGQLFMGSQNFGSQPKKSQYIIGCQNFDRAHLGTTKHATCV